MLNDGEGNVCTAYYFPKIKDNAEEGQQLSPGRGQAPGWQPDRSGGKKEALRGAAR